MNKLFLLFFLMLSHVGYSKTLKIDAQPLYQMKNLLFKTLKIGLIVKKALILLKIQPKPIGQK